MPKRTKVRKHIEDNECKYCGEPSGPFSVCLSCKDDQEKARYELSYAIKKGEVIKLTYCQSCLNDFPKEQIHGHHFKGYSKNYWLTVLWLCASCHTKAHREDFP